MGSSEPIPIVSLCEAERGKARHQASDEQLPYAPDSCAVLSVQAAWHTSLGGERSPLTVRRNKMNPSLYLSLPICGLIMLSSCGSRYPEEVRINSSYSVLTSSPGTTFVTKNNPGPNAAESSSFVIGPDVQTWKHQKDYLTGEVVFRANSSPDLTTSKDEVGFFILELSTGKLIKGMQKEDFVSRCKALAID